MKTLGKVYGKTMTYELLKEDWLYVMRKHDEHGICDQKVMENYGDMLDFFKDKEMFQGLIDEVGLEKIAEMITYNRG